MFQKNEIAAWIFGCFYVSFTMVGATLFSIVNEVLHGPQIVLVSDPFTAFTDVRTNRRAPQVDSNFLVFQPGRFMVDGRRRNEKSGVEFAARGLFLPDAPMLWPNV